MINNKFEEILKEIRTNKNYIVITDEEDAENNQPGPSNSKNKGLRNKHASNTTLDKNKNQDDRFYPSEMGELRQPYTPLGITEDTLDESIIINENRHEKADHHIVETIVRRSFQKLKNGFFRQVKVFFIRRHYVIFLQLSNFHLVYSFICSFM